MTSAEGETERLGHEARAHGQRARVADEDPHGGAHHDELEIGRLVERAAGDAAIGVGDAGDQVIRLGRSGEPIV